MDKMVFQCIGLMFTLGLLGNWLLACPSSQERANGEWRFCFGVFCELANNNSD